MRRSRRSARGAGSVHAADGRGDAARWRWSRSTGAVVGLWQANQHIGATLVNEPGALIWKMITESRSGIASMKQCPAWAAGPWRWVRGRRTTYSRWVGGSRWLHGAADARGAEPLACVLRGADADATAAQARAAGGQVAVEPFDIHGRTISGPDGTAGGDVQCAQPGAQ